MENSANFSIDLRKITSTFDIEKTDGVLMPSAILLLQEWGLIPKVLPCKNCQAPLKIQADRSKPDGSQWRCRKSKADGKRCNYGRAIRQGTIFGHSNLPIWKCLTIIHLWCDRHKQSQIVIQAQISIRTAAFWTKLCREVVEIGLMERSEKIGGVNKIVELVESEFSQCKYNRRRHVEGQWTFGGVERETGRCFIVPVPQRSKTELFPIIRDYILPGTTIISDCWNTYDCLEGEEFQELKVNNALNFVDPEDDVPTNTIEGQVASMSGLLDYGAKKNDIRGYFAKYIFLKRAKEKRINPHLEFYKWAGEIFNPKDG